MKLIDIIEKYGFSIKSKMTVYNKKGFMNIYMICFNHIFCFRCHLEYRDSISSDFLPTVSATVSISELGFNFRKKRIIMSREFHLVSS